MENTKVIYSLIKYKSAEILRDQYFRDKCFQFHLRRGKLTSEIISLTNICSVIYISCTPKTIISNLNVLYYYKTNAI